MGIHDFKQRRSTAREGGGLGDLQRIATILELKWCFSEAYF